MEKRLVTIEKAMNGIVIIETVGDDIRVFVKETEKAPNAAWDTNVFRDR